MVKGFREPIEKPRRFYKAVDIAPEEAGFAVRLDGRPVHTPGGARLALPTRALADQVAQEWAGQGEVLEIPLMHATRLANTAIDAVPTAREATAEVVANYAASDLLCYWAEAPEALVARQRLHWGPVLDWAEAEVKLPLVRATGVVHQSQPEPTLRRIREIVLGLDDFSLAGLAFGAGLFGSAILALAVQRGWAGGEQAFSLSRLDETWQEEKWGVDAEAAERAQALQGEALMLERWFAGLRAG